MSIGKTKSYNKREFNRMLIDNGFELSRIRGSHEIVINKDPNYMVVRRLIKEFDLQI